jgi:hypothetical protein
MGTKQSDEFFAAVDSESIAGILEEKVEDWIKFTQTTTTYNRMRESWKMYYGLSKEGLNSSSTIREAGPRGEYSLLYCNDYRNILQHLLVMTTSQRPAMECRAANTDSESLEQCVLGNALLDWYMRDKKVERFLKQNVENALSLSEGFLSMDWEPTSGSMYGVNPMSGMPVYEGDISFQNYTPLDVVRDPYRTDTLLPWGMVIRWKNRWNLAAKYPDLADDILACEPEMLWKLREDFFNRMAHTESDLIPEMTFYHEPCEALPQGRLVRFLTDNIKLIDSPLPYSKIPLFRTSPADQVNTPYGYTPGFDLMGPQYALQMLDSIILTNQKTFGVGVMKVPEGNNLSFSQLADGLSVITVNEKNGKLEPVVFPSTPAEIFNYRTALKQDLQNISAVNSVVRGDPQSEITSGSFAALVASQALQFNSGLQMSYAQTCEDVGGMIIEMLQRFATTERVAKIAGKANQYMLKSFSNKDIHAIKTVVVDMANPLMKTTAGRMKMAEDMQQMGYIKRPEQYMMVMETGKLDPEVENERTSLMLIKRENEMLRKGQNPSVMITDDHRQHVLEHLTVLDDPDSRQNPTLATSVTQHILKHVQEWKSADPNLLQAIGRQPLIVNPPPGMPAGLVDDPNKDPMQAAQASAQAAQMPPAAPGGAMPPPSQPGPMGPKPTIPKPPPSQMASTAPINPKNMPRQPQMPKVAGTNQRFENPTVGGPLPGGQ